MGIRENFKSFFTKKNEEIQVKSYENSSSINFISDLFMNEGNAKNLYRSTSAISSIINMILNDFSNMNMLLKNKKTLEEVEGSEVIEFIKNLPSETKIGEQILMGLFLDFLLCGNAYLFAFGSGKKPTIFEILPIEYVNFELGDDFSDVKIIVNSPVFKKFNGIYKRKNSYTYEDGLKKIYHIKDFSSGQDYGLRGESPLSLVFKESRINIFGKERALATLKGVTSPSGILTKNTKKDGILSSEDNKNFEKVRQEFNRIQSTRGHKGIIVLDGEFSYVDLSKGSIDIDFSQAMKWSSDEIAKAYGVPLTLVNNDNSTYNNLSTSIPYYYNTCVLNFGNRFLDYISRIFLEIFGLKYENFEIVLDIEKNPYLMQSKIENAVKMKGLQALSTNELRDYLGYDDIEGGSDVLINAGQIPINQVSMDVYAPITPINQEIPIDEENSQDVQPT